MNKRVSATEARNQFFKLLEFAGKPGASITITLEGRPPVVLMSQEEFEGWQETLEIMADPKLVRDIRQAMKEKSAVPWSSLKTELGL